MINKLNPWKIPTLTPKGYKELAEYYSLESINFKLKKNPTFIRRNLIIGHDGFLKWLKYANARKKVSLVSGFMTSGFLHLGSLAVIKQMVYYQKNYGAKIIIPIADLEAMCVRKTDKIKIKTILIDFLAHFFAAGLSPKNTLIYLQTKNLEVLKEASLFTGKISLEDLEKIYDRKLNLGEIYSSLVMVADILYPQALNYESTLINLGIDEISHFVLVKEIIPLLGKNFYIPSITYNKMITGLNGSKMGKSMPENSILLIDKPEIAKSKLIKLKNRDMELFQNTAFNILEWYCEDDLIIKKIIGLSDKRQANNLAIDKACNVVENLLKDHQREYKKNFLKAKKLADKLMDD